MRQRTVVFDLETGGLDPHLHPVIQYAAIAVDDQWRELETIHRRVQFNPVRADPAALEKNSYSQEAWAGATAGPLAAEELCNFLKTHATVRKISKTGNPYLVARLCAHNARFDCDFIGAWCKRLKLFLPAAIYEPLDTLALARWVGTKDPSAPDNYRLETVCQWLGVELTGAHDALADVRATVEVGRILSGRIFDPRGGGGANTQTTEE